MNEIEIPKGTYKLITVTVTDDSGSAYDLTNFNAYLGVKTSGATSTQLISETGVISSPDTGVITFTLTADQTNITAGSYLYDVKIQHKTSSNVVFSVIDKASFKILDSITNITI
ncbi:MAG TPA: BppU family phage baseplate upper protein [Caldisericia bacterium]|nr:BppU family phage baseplate upper protein [Caldisericia bacterium]